jgi:archaellum component FlaG (FlaF/FlaG flagellin family)
MSTTTNYTGEPDAYTHRQVWGMMTNDAKRRLLHNQNIEIEKNGNNPPTVKSGTSFYVYDTATDNIDADALSQNTVYPDGETSVEYLRPKAVWESGDQTFTFSGSGEFPTISDGTWFLFCYGTGTTPSTKGQGLYGVVKSGDGDIQTAFAYDELKGGYYLEKTIGADDIWCKVLAVFEVASSVVEELRVYIGQTKERGYIKHKGFTITGTDDIVAPEMLVDIDGKLWHFIDSKAIDFNGQPAAWTTLAINEVTIEITAPSIASFDNWTISGNQLNAMSVYDEKKNYMVDTITGTARRVICIFYFDGTNFDYVFQIDNVPKTKISCSSNTGQTLFTGSYYRFNFEDIEYDLNSEITNGANWRFTPKTNKTVNIDFRVTVISGTGSNDNEIFHAFLYDDTSNILSLYEDILITSQARIQWKGSTTFNALTTNELNIHVRQVCGSTRTTYNSNSYNWIKINEL